ncbi:IclR family transcriptional regulator [Pigmentiphaga kullae]|uniref:IclR family transcriptional regulator n=1 Tax=Pigmentiphaga kullae TaxID=151784 RepID=A0A4Q7N8H6_9BURK|nr:IclR family transcriptional regulator C-terminal domain-containing protein [Pigmentiphaga kullae]RZS78287.1 IclR family transcriptional regulator [Pigmentiphaga kullae]
MTEPQLPATDDGDDTPDNASAPRKDPYWVDALAQGLSVLEAFDCEQPSLTLTELAQRLGWSRSKPYRFVHTLEKLGFLEREEVGRRYRLTAHAMKLGFAYLNRLPLVELAQPIMNRLRTEVGASVHMAILDRDELVYVAQARIPLPTSIDIHVGSRMPPHSSSIGRILLAYKPRADIARILDGAPIPALTEKSTVDPAAFRALLDTARERGYVYNDEEFHRGVRSIAAPVLNAQGEVVAGLNATSMIYTFTDEVVAGTVIPAVVRAARELSQALGYRER